MNQAELLKRLGALRERFLKRAQDVRHEWNEGIDLTDWKNDFTRGFMSGRVTAYCNASEWLGEVISVLSQGEQP